MLINRRKFSAVCALLVPMILSVSASADGLMAPSESPILVVSGNITKTNKGRRALLDRPMLETMSEAKIRTKTPWYTDEVEFEGVSFLTLLSEVGATGEKLLITALDDYSVEVDIDDLVKNKAILALKRDGNNLSISDKGPLFVVYPYDSKPELKNEKYYSRSVWQVRLIEVR